MISRKLTHPFWNKTVIIAALGYAVDIYDLVLFSIVRISSLKDLGFAAQELTDIGMVLLNLQMGGMLLGGILWGSLGDKRGRLSVMFGAIALYSAANFLNAFVTTKEMYGLLRFLAGVGLAGELGAAVTLVSEGLPTHLRGYSTAFIATVGILGGILAAITTNLVPWRIAYGMGGVLGLLLLLARTRLVDSGLFEKMQRQAVERGGFFALFRSWERSKRYICTIAIGVPCWFVLGILLAFGPEIAQQLGVTGTLVVGTGVLFQYTGAAIGDFATGVWSQEIGSRKKVILASIVGTAVLVSLFLSAKEMTPSFYYGLYFALGLTTGYWAVFITVAVEQFGTNLRATAASTAPNFVRGAVIPMTGLIQLLKGQIGLVPAVAVVGILVLGAATLSLRMLRESYAKDLDFFEI